MFSVSKARQLFLPCDSGASCSVAKQAVEFPWVLVSSNRLITHPVTCIRISVYFQEDIKQRQRRLNELRQSEESLPLPLLDQPQPQLLSLARELPVWATGIPDCEATKHKFPYNRRLNEMVAVHMGAINALDCDVLVMPISSCYKNKTSDNNDKNSELVGFLAFLILYKKCTCKPFRLRF